MKDSTPANYRLGQALAKSDRVHIITFTPGRVVATVNVPKGQTRTVTFTSQATQLVWQCTCSKDTPRLCKHAVAAALITWETAPKRR